MSRKTTGGYGLISRLNHWAVALAMIGMLAFGLYLENAEIARADRGALMGLHKSLGALFLAFALWRVGYRLAQGFPASAAAMSPLLEFAAKAAHWGLLACILIMPLSGLLMSLYGGHAVDVFGLFAIDGFEKNASVSGAAGAAHGVVGKLAIALILLHIGAALKHHFIDRDATLRRMIGSAEG